MLSARSRAGELLRDVKYHAFAVGLLRLFLRWADFQRDTLVRYRCCSGGQVLCGRVRGIDGVETFRCRSAGIAVATIADGGILVCDRHLAT